MSVRLKIENAFGLVATTSNLRASKSGLEYEGVLPAPNWTNRVVKRNGSVGDTVNEMKKLIFRSAWQTRELAQLLKKDSLYKTCESIWDFLYKHFKYKEDDEGKEQLRESALSWNIRTSRGIDCDDFSIFASTILVNLNIPHYLRIARYRGKNYFQHVYVVVPIDKNRYITIDAVLNEFDAEKEPVETKDYLIMNNSNLSGIDISVLGGFGDEPTNELLGILYGVDFQETDRMEGLGEVPTAEQELGAICNHLKRTRRAISQYPHLVREVEHPENLLRMLDYALKYWNTPQRDQALDILCGEEDRQNNLLGFGGINDNEELSLFFGTNHLGEVELLGKIKAPKKFFNKVKQAVKKVGQGIKKVVKAVVKYNPATIAARGGLLLAMKLNVGQMASRIKYAYLTEPEARQRGLDMNEWNKLKKSHKDIENMFVNVLQGKPENLRSAILTGKGGGLSGTDSLGVVVAATAATTTAAATPFITKIINWLKGINFKKLTAGIKKGVQLFKKNKTNESAPESEASVSDESSASDTSSFEDTSNTNSASERGGGESSTSDKGSNTENLPSVRTSENLPNTAEPVKEGFFDKVKTWIKANPVPATIAAVGTAGVLYYLLKPKSKSGLSGTKKGGKKKKGKAKTNAPALPAKRKKKSKKTAKAISGKGKIKTVKL